MNKNYITLEEHNLLVKKKISFPPKTRMIVEGANGKLYFSEAETLVLTRLDKDRSGKLESLVGREKKFLKEMCSTYENVRAALSGTIRDMFVRQELDLEGVKDVKVKNDPETINLNSETKGE